MSVFVNEALIFCVFQALLSQQYFNVSCRNSKHGVITFFWSRLSENTVNVSLKCIFYLEIFSFVAANCCAS